MSESPEAKRKKIENEEEMKEEVKVYGDDATFFRLKFDNIRDIEKNAECDEEKIINGLSIKLCVDRKCTWMHHGMFKRDMLIARLSCKYDHVYSTFFFNSFIDAKLINFMDDSQHLVLTEVSHFTPKNTSYSFNIIDWSALMNETHGFIKDGAIIIEAKVTPGRCKFIRLPQFDFSVPSEMSDVTLIVGSNKLHVSKQILAHHSSYFKALFFGNFKESKESEIEVKDLDFTDFDNFLKLIYGDESKNEWSQLKQLLPLLDRFDCERLKYDAQTCLMSSSLSYTMKLSLASEYRLHFVLEDCVAKLDSLVKIKKVIESGEYNYLSNDVKDELQKKMKSLEDSTGTPKLKKAVKTTRMNGKSRILLDIPQTTFDFSGSDEISDAILVVEGQKVHVSTQILALQSSYFKSLFFGNNKQPKESEIELKDLGHEDFIILLNLLYGDKTKMDWSHMRQLLPLLERFGCEKLNYETQVCVMEKPGIEIKTKFSMAREFQLHFLIDLCIAKVDRASKMRTLMRSNEYRSLPEDIKEELKRKMKVLEKEEDDEENMRVRRIKMQLEEEEEELNNYNSDS